jgi:hypothetical protein
MLSRAAAEEQNLAQSFVGVNPGRQRCGFEISRVQNPSCSGLNGVTFNCDSATRIGDFPTQIVSTSLGNSMDRAKAYWADRSNRRSVSICLPSTRSYFVYRKNKPISLNPECSSYESSSGLTMKIACITRQAAGKVPPERDYTGFPQRKNPIFADSVVPQSQQNL